MTDPDLVRAGQGAGPGERFSGRVANILMGSGFVLGLGAAASWMVTIPSLPGFMERVVLAKLMLGSAAALMIAGAALRRSIRASARVRELEARQLGGPSSHHHSPDREAARVAREDR